MSKIKTKTPVSEPVQALVSEYQNNPENILEILSRLQADRGTLDQETLLAVADSIDLPPQKVYGVASFYSMLSLTPRKHGILRACTGPVCWLHGASKTRQVLDEAYRDDPAWTVEGSSCLGLCDRAPAILVNEDQAGPVLPEQAHKLKTSFRGQSTDYSTPRQGELRVMLAHSGEIDSDSLASALSYGAYQGLKAALSQLPESVVAEIENAGLTGRGGAGFPVGRKWKFVLQAQKKPKIVICNADESEPLIFKDRVLIDTNPHQILEGMAIAGYATGAEEAYIYIRGEYVHQEQRLKRAIQQAEAAGWLGDHIQGSEFSFHIHVHAGAGAYICGEETALIESLEGKRGEPRLRPPYPPTSGFHSLPTLVNNVETYAAVPGILRSGAAWYRSISSAATPGTKLYMILGHVNRPGLFEAPFGLTLRQAIDDFGGGMRPGSQFHFALTGGAAGTIVPADLLDIPIDYSSAAKGVSLGAGSFLICDQEVSAIAFLRELLAFFAFESCGKCTPCRVGTHRCLEILTNLAAGRGQASDLTELAELADNMQDASFCGLGQSVPIPLKSALTHFRAEFVEAAAR